MMYLQLFNHFLFELKVNQSKNLDHLVRNEHNFKSMIRFTSSKAQRSNLKACRMSNVVKLWALELMQMQFIDLIMKI